MSWSEKGISKLRFFIYTDDGEDVTVRAEIKYSYTPGTTSDEYDFDYEVKIVDAPDFITEKDIRNELDQWSLFDIINPEDFNTY
jgi:hypothetical protein